MMHGHSEGYKQQDTFTMTVRMLILVMRTSLSYVQYEYMDTYNDEFHV